MRFDCLTVAILAAILMCFAPAADAAKTSDAGANENTCRSFVQSFYKWYLSKPQTVRACKKRASAFSPELLKQLNDDYAAS